MRPDWYCAFLASNESKELIRGQYRVLVIPDAVVQGVKGVSLQKDNGRYWDFEIAPENLANFFREYLPTDEYLAQGVMQ